MTDADKRMNPLHSGSGPADIRIRINLDSNPGSLLLVILAVAEVCSLWVYSLPEITTRTLDIYRDTTITGGEKNGELDLFLTFSLSQLKKFAVV